MRAGNAEHCVWGGCISFLLPGRDLGSQGSCRGSLPQGCVAQVCWQQTPRKAELLPWAGAAAGRAIRPLPASASTGAQPCIVGPQQPATPSLAFLASRPWLWLPPLARCLARSL